MTDSQFERKVLDGFRSRQAPETDQPDLYCCDRMKEDLSGTCQIHTRWECQDLFFSYNAKFDEYGLLVDGLSVVQIAFCPFCGTKSPDSKRDIWFDRLEALGFEDILFNEGIPEEFKTAAWRRDLET